MASRITIDRKEFGQLYTRWYERFVIIARRYVREEAVAEDLVTDSFIAFWEQRDTLPEEVNVPAYLLTIVKNNCLNWIQAQRTHLRIQKDIHNNQFRMLSANFCSLEACDPQQLFADELSQIVARSLVEMPELTRLVFEKNRSHDMTYAQIATAHGITVRRVTTEIQRALAILRDNLSDYLPFKSS